MFVLSCSVPFLSFLPFVLSFFRSATLSLSLCMTLCATLCVTLGVTLYPSLFTLCWSVGVSSIFFESLCASLHISLRASLPSDLISIGTKTKLEKKTKLSTCTEPQSALQGGLATSHAPPQCDGPQRQLLGPVDKLCHRAMRPPLLLVLRLSRPCEYRGPCTL